MKISWTQTLCLKMPCITERAVGLKLHICVAYVNGPVNGAVSEC